MLKRARLEDTLVDAGVLSPDKIETIQEEQKRTGEKVEQILVKLGLMEEQTVLYYLARHLDIPYLALSQFQYQVDVIKEIPEAFARKFKAVPIAKYPQGYLVAMHDPIDLLAYDELTRKLKRNFRICLIKASELNQVIDQIYRKKEDIASLAEELATEIKGHQQQEAVTPPDEDTDLGDAPVIKLIDSIFEDALQAGASDVHIEPGRNMLRIRTRIDGMLQEQIMPGNTIANAVISRIKIMARLDISEKRLPQDGRFSLKLKNRAVDVRVSTMPIVDGESLVMRLLDQSKGLLSIDTVGMDEASKEVLRRQLKKPHGLILVTGPTGSGKSTTLYSALSDINLPEKKIITVEDPVEYSLPRVNQVHVQPKIGLTFASVLRAALRQDPDVVMVGEIRDEETASIAVRAAMTGHLVLSTLHTNDAASTPIRLLQMGVEPYLVASALSLVIAQRLIRKVCSACSEKYEPSKEEWKWMKSVDDTIGSSQHFVIGKGCGNCSNTGYKGRIGVYERLEMDEKLADELRRADTSSFIQAVHKHPRFESMVKYALRLAGVGTTSIPEVFKLAGDLVDE